MLHATNISFSYDQRRVLDNVSLTLESGEIVGLIGPNGAGKSTLIKVMSGLLSPQSGEVTIQGTSLRDLTPAKIARNIAVVPQVTDLMFPYRVMEVVLMGRYTYTVGTLFDRPEDVNIVRESLAQVEALEFEDRYYNQLSGGEQQLVIIARALAQKTNILLLDEPASALDLKHQVFIARLLSRLSAQENKAFLLAGHNINYMACFCHRLIVLKKGKVFAFGIPREIITPDLISEVYDTEVEILYDKAHNPITTLPPL